MFWLYSVVYINSWIVVKLCISFHTCNALQLSQLSKWFTFLTNLYPLRNKWVLLYSFAVLGMEELLRKLANDIARSASGGFLTVTGFGLCSFVKLCIKLISYYCLLTFLTLFTWTCFRFGWSQYITSWNNLMFYTIFY